jgi:hypothetical protein
MTDIIECDKCHEKVDLDKLDSESFYGGYEDRGECHGTPCKEYMTWCFICPNCGKKVAF